MVLILLISCPLTLIMRGGAALPPAPLPDSFEWGQHALGWFQGSFWPDLAGVALIIAFGHAFLSMSGFETLAKVYREIAAPKLKNLYRTGFAVCSFALLSTGVITFFAALLIPDEVRSQYFDNLIGGLVMNLEGPLLLRIVFHAFVVVVGGLILSGAVNTSMIGANSVLNRVAEDGVLLSWFRKPHSRYGTTSRIINFFTALQIFTILFSRGDVYTLGEAYAFGVVWSFFLKACGVFVLRLQRSDQEYRVPFNFRVFGREIPLGLLFTMLVLFMVALANLFSKQVATIYGGTFTVLFFGLFTISERINRHGEKRHEKALEEFNLEFQPEVNSETVEVRPGATLVAVRDYNRLNHMQWVLDKRNRHREIVVMTARPLSAGEGEYELSQEQFFAHYEKRLFSRVVEMAEKAGRHVDLLAVPTVNPILAMVQTAANLKCSVLVTGVSPRMANEELARRIGLAWESMPEPRHAFSLAIVDAQGQPEYYHLGPHTPRLWPEDVTRTHALWLELAEREGLGGKLHHRDVVGLALKYLERELNSEKRAEILEELQERLKKGGH